MLLAHDRSRLSPIAPVLAALALAACGGGSSAADSGAPPGADSGASPGDDSGAPPGPDSGRADSGPPSPEMGFFATSTGSGEMGGDLGGLAGADGRCQALATAVGAGGRTWRAYLSTTTVNARDRIGTGPWRNHAGAIVAPNLDDLHSVGIPSAMILDENGDPVPIEEHDIVTGSQASGVVTDPPYTCNDWTTSAPDAYAWVGHTDWSGDGREDDTWNATHETPCDRAGMMGTLSAGRIYCFAAD